MSEIGFYHLTRSAVEQALPRLLSRALAMSQKALVVCPTPEQVAFLEDLLWASNEAWLPHGGTSQTLQEQRHAIRQPIWLSTQAEPLNGAKFLFRINGAQTDGLARFDRVFDLFDGQDPEMVASARIRWADVKNSGFTPIYWRQTDQGWEKAA